MKLIKSFQEEFEITEEEKEILIEQLSDEFCKHAHIAAKEEIRAILENGWDAHYLPTRQIIFECMVVFTSEEVLTMLNKHRRTL